MRIRRDQESRRRGKFPDNSPTPYPRRKLFPRTKNNDQSPESPARLRDVGRSKSADSCANNSSEVHNNNHCNNSLDRVRHGTPKLAFITTTVEEPIPLPASPQRRLKWRDKAVSAVPETAECGTQLELVLCDAECQVVPESVEIGVQTEVQTEYVGAVSNDSPSFTPPPSPSPRTIVSVSPPSPVPDTSPITVYLQSSSLTTPVVVPTSPPPRVAVVEDLSRPNSPGISRSSSEEQPDKHISLNNLTKEIQEQSPDDEPDSEVVSKEPEDALEGSSQPVLPTTCDIGVQTDNGEKQDDDVVRFAVMPPHCTKVALYRTASLPVLTSIRSVDEAAKTLPPEAEVDITSLAGYFSRHCFNDDLLLVRAFFLWTSTKLTYSVHTENRTADEVLSSRCGTCTDFVSLFTALCEVGGVRVKRLHGFTKSHDITPGHAFMADDERTGEWNAVFFRGSWWLVDCFFAAGYVDRAGHFHRHLDEHFFLTDPEKFAWMHFPCDDTEPNYSRWQLLPEPRTLEQFNSLPQVTSDFFSLGMKVEPMLSFPLLVREQAEIIVAADQPLRYKYHMAFADDEEHSHLNRHVFCRLLKENRLTGSFLVAPPKLGKYVLRVYAKPEKELANTGSSLDYVAAFPLRCVKVRNFLQPWPTHDLPWGLTYNFFSLGATLINHYSANIVLWGGKRRLVFRKSVELLTLHNLYDANGRRVDDKGIIAKEEDKRELRLIIFSPPDLGFYKLLLYGVKKPRVKGKCRVPLIAAFLIENKVSLGTPHKNERQRKRK